MVLGFWVEKVNVQTNASFENPTAFNVPLPVPVIVRVDWAEADEVPRNTPSSVRSERLVNFFIKMPGGFPEWRLPVVVRAAFVSACCFPKSCSSSGFMA